MRIVIVGGGTAGWMTGVALSSALPKSRYQVELVESEAIGTVGVGEATLPQLWAFNETFGLDEAELMANSNATFKLGIEFVDWGHKGSAYIHPFSSYGGNIGGTRFHQQWVRSRQAGRDWSLEEFSYGIVASRQNRFGHPSEHSWTEKAYNYAYHFDAHLYAAYLRKVAIARGLLRTEGRIENVELDSQRGTIRRLQLEGGRSIEGDFFIDCSGFKALLIGEALGAAYDDWTKWLPCDRAVAVPCERVDPIAPYTKATAHEAGWQWRIPLQHRTGNGYVYASEHIDDDEAASRLLSRLDGEPLADPRFLRFKAGRRTSSWTKNCIAIGLASGFLEPLESTSIYLVQQAVLNFLDLLPTQPEDHSAAKEFNRRVDLEYARVRDFLILHYHASTRGDAALWRYCRDMDVPDSLKQRIELFRHRGFIDDYDDGLFGAPSWLAVYVGQGVMPQRYDPVADNIPLDRTLAHMEQMRDKIASDVERLPTMDETLQSYCPAEPTLTGRLT
ncbi:tryptophan halogenase family protein [Parvularcula dongshanensis]|uniref:Tryptophan halogenase n=1 Tax=Parvularcula dongshanensis TaxID=1173995 RepID=A0A840I718_9PROT|nr:tryptophan halogenase family protein [Parvularcula dongshanensis]MBB4660292.1 tryptophan halogenase [Parvularcula dongshanensis]